MLNTRRQPAFAGRQVSRGFTLVELLLVMFVMSVLVTLVVGVGIYAIDSGRQKETVTKQVRLLAAVEAYRKVTGKVPATGKDTAGKETGDIAKFLENLKGADLVIADATAKARVLKRLGSEVATILDEGGDLTRDGYGNEMRYFADRGVGGKPLIISAGPDGDFGGSGTATQQKQRQKDNIRSDTQDDAR